MLRKTSMCLLVALLLTGMVLFQSAPLAAQETGAVPVQELEEELTDIEKELTDLERKIDTMLEDLVDPKITSLSIFFSSVNIRGRVPVSIQIRIDDDPLVSRDFTETDRLVLVRGGAIEIHSGIAEPAAHTLAVECFLSSSSPGGGIVSTGKTTFSFEAKRASANFLEITLNEDTSKRVPAYRMSARHWSKEP